MKYAIVINGEVVRTGLEEPLPESHDGVIVPETVDPQPSPEWPEILVEGPMVIDVSNGVPSGVRHTWVVRDRTSDERRREWAARDFDERVDMIAPGAWDRLALAAENEALPENVRAQLRTAIRQSEKAVSVISDHPETLQFVGAAVMVGVLTEAEADSILNGP